VQPEGLGKFKKINHLFGNLTCDLPACRKIKNKNVKAIPATGRGAL
jgi:hypothetical protein